MTYDPDDARVRRLARHHGYALQRSRSRNPERPDHGRYRLIDPDRNFIVAGATWSDYDLSISQAEAWLRES